MGTWDSEDIFQDKVDNLLGDTKGVKEYICDIMVLSKEFFAKNKDQLRVTVASMSSTIIKFKMSMFSFGLN